MSGTTEPTAITNPPHTMAVFRVLKNAKRLYEGGGTAASITIAAVTDFARTAAKGFSGVMTVAPGVALPLSCTVTIRQSSVVKATVGGVVSSPSGAWTATLAANTLTAAGAYTAVVTTSSPASSATSNSFNVT